MGNTCGKGGSARVAPLPSVADFVVLWDVENLPIPKPLPASASRAAFTAGDVGEALLRHCLLASGGLSSTANTRLVCVHPDRYPMPLKNSLRTRGVQMLDAGAKRGAVDTHLKSYLNDLLIETLLEAKRPGERWLWLASGDADFAGDLRRARRCGFRVGVIHGLASNQDYYGQSDATVNWDAIIAECTAGGGRKGSAGAADAAGGAELGGGGGAVVAAEAAAQAPLALPGAPVAAPSSEPPPEGSSGEASSPSGKRSGEKAETPLAGVSSPNTRPPCKYFLSPTGCTRKSCRFPHVRIGSANKGEKWTLPLAEAPALSNPQ